MLSATRHAKHACPSQFIPHSSFYASISCCCLTSICLAQPNAMYSAPTPATVQYLKMTVCLPLCPKHTRTLTHTSDRSEAQIHRLSLITPTCARYKTINQHC
jgi:hypothetical protein